MNDIIKEIDDYLEQGKTLIPKLKDEEDRLNARLGQIKVLLKQLEPKKTTGTGSNKTKRTGSESGKWQEFAVKYLTKNGESAKAAIVAAGVKEGLKMPAATNGLVALVDSGKIEKLGKGRYKIK